MSISSRFRRAAALDGQGNLVITAKKENPGNYNRWYGRCEYTSARLPTQGQFTQTYAFSPLVAVVRTQNYRN